MYTSLLSNLLVVNHRSPPSLKTSHRFWSLWIELTEWNHTFQQNITHHWICWCQWSFFINGKYLLPVSRNIYFVHPQLCEKVKEIAKQGIPSFKWVAWQVEGRVWKWKKMKKSMENQEMLEGRLLIHGRRGHLSFQLQPLDLGIIHNFKGHYQKLFLRFILPKIDSVIQLQRWLSQ